MAKETSKDLLAEQGTLASIFDEPEYLDEISEILEPADFHEPANETLYATMLMFRDAGKSITPVAIISDLKRTGELTKIGGMSYMQELINPNSLASYATDAVGYAKIVKEHSNMRKLQVLADNISDATVSGSGFTASEALGYAEDAVFALTNSHTESEGVRSISSLFAETIEDIVEAGQTPEGAAVGVPSGFVDLDKKTSGFHPGQLILIGARPAMGKSTIAVDFARHAGILAGKSVVIFSLEMGKKEIMNRVISAQTRIPLQQIKTGQLNRDEWATIRDMKTEVEQSNLFIDDYPKVNIGRIRSVLMKQMMRPEGCDLVVIDYLQLMEVTSRRGNASRENEVSELSRGLKLLAKEFGLPIIVLSQLNRGNEQRADKTPAPSDLRESGSLEQDADVILLLHRPEVYDENDRPGEADLIIAKQRNGPTGKIVLVPMLEISKFANGSGIIASEISVASANDDTPF